MIEKKVGVKQTQMMLTVPMTCMWCPQVICSVIMVCTCSVAMQFPAGYSGMHGMQLQVVHVYMQCSKAVHTWFTHDFHTCRYNRKRNELIEFIKQPRNRNTLYTKYSPVTTLCNCQNILKHLPLLHSVSQSFAAAGFNSGLGSLQHFVHPMLLKKIQFGQFQLWCTIQNLVYNTCTTESP